MIELDGIPFELPPEILEARRKLEQIGEQMADLEVTNRRQMHYWAAIVCNCRPWPELGRGPRDPSPPQWNCPLHGRIAVCPDGMVR